MSFYTAMRAKDQIADGQTIPIYFLTPIESVIFASLSLSMESSLVKETLKFHGDSAGYAEACGLRAQLDGNYCAPKGTGLQGRTYSGLTRLRDHDEVADCNSQINDLIHAQYESKFPRRTLSLITHVIGELHDNVASHAGGCGFSAAQVIQGKLHFAIADSGVGMPKTVRKHVGASLSDNEAVLWCLERGNTTAATADDPWAQRLPEDCMFNPYPESVKTVTGSNNHMGEGLWQLRQLVGNMNGELQIASDQASILVRKDSIVDSPGPYHWSGVALAFSLTVQDVVVVDTLQQQKLDNLSDRLGVFE